MENHFKLIFEEEPTSISDITGKLPTDLLYPLKSAQKAIEYRFRGSRLIGQQLHFEDYHAESFQLDSDVPFTIGYEIHTDRMFFTFVMHNDIEFYGSEGLITIGKDFTFHLAAEKKGNYKVKCRAGRSVLVVVSIMPDWLLLVTKKCTLLHKIIKQLLESDLPYDVLPACPIDAEVFNWLLKAREYDYNNEIARINFISSHIIMGLGKYEQQLHISHSAKIYNIKNRIDTNYFDPDIDLYQIIEESNLTYHTVKRKFNKTYNKTPREYCNQRRMVHANKLIQDSNLPIKEVWKIVGFKEESAFRKAYKKFLKFGTN